MRSPPQNSSPSKTKVGTPKTPEASASPRRRSCSAPPSPIQEGREARGAPASASSAATAVDVLRIELAPPEAVEGEIVVGTKHAVLLGIEHPGIGRPGIEDLGRSLEHQALLVGEAARVHVAVAHAAPVMGIALLHRSHVRGDVERVGPPNQLDLVVILERIGRRLGDEGIGTDIVAPEGDHTRLLSRRHIHQKARPTASSSNTLTRTA